MSANRCAACGAPLPIHKKVCNRACAAKAWKSLHSPILGKEKRRRLEKEREGKD